MPALHAERREVLLDDKIMDQLAEHGSGTCGGRVMGFTQGIADAEAHAVVGS